MNFFIIDLDETAAYQMGFRAITLRDGHYLTEGSGDDTFSLLCL